MKQDRQGARTVQDLERKYQFKRQFSDVMGVAEDAQTSAKRAQRKIDKAIKESDLEEQLNPLKVDYIVEVGETNGWIWRKWNSGLAECWKTITHNTALSTSWGSMYYGTTTPRMNYPFAFAVRPTEVVSLGASTYQGIIYPEKDGKGENSKLQCGCYNICRTSSITTATDFYINFHISGRWR